jgi:peptidoglycan/xylan/chitin deacetylase (PgdA/CDA1 family)
MSAWLDGLRRALDAAARPVDFFFRDDDAGWRDGRLFALLDLFGRHGLPIDVAAIPRALTPALASELRSRVEAAPERVAVHQHGFAHLNHEREGRKCEFGPSRSRERQQEDIEAGRRLLAEAHGLRGSGVFTPPWNRCTEATGDALRACGFRVLSRDATARPLGVEGLYELPVRFDWFARRKGVRLSREESGALLAESASAAASPVGVMFHHELMDDEELTSAGELLALLAAHTRARCLLISSIAQSHSDAASPLSGGAHTVETAAPAAAAARS